MLRVPHALAAVMLASAVSSPVRGQSPPAQPPFEPGLPAGFSPPRLLERVEPRFPEQARREGASGTVLVQIVVERDGTVREARVAKGAGHGFDEAALEAARKLRFEPATQDGAPIPVQLDYEIHFQLTPGIPTLREVT